MSCQCPITTDYVHKSSFPECSNELAVLRLSLIDINTINNKSELLIIIEKWITESPLIILDGVELSIVKVCEELKCDSVVSSSSIFSVSQTPGLDSSNIMNISNNADGQERANNIKETIFIVLYVIGPTILMILILIIIIICIVKLKNKRTRYIVTINSNVMMILSLLQK